MSQKKAYAPLRDNDQLIALISDTTGESVDAVTARLAAEAKHPGCNVARDFARAGGPRYEWGDHLERFYGSTNAFIYELAIWNRNLLKQRLRRWTARHMRLRGRPLDLLSVGDGLGFDCLYFTAKRHRATYFELPGVSERFARRLFERSKRPIPVITDPQAVPKESFDAITCFDVLEHVPDPPAVVRSLASYLRPGGMLYVSAPFFMILPWYPTHLRKNRRFSGSVRLYEQAGLKLAGGQFSWYPIVLQKPPADAVAPTACAMIRATAVVQRLGRRMAWPFTPIHLLRILFDRSKIQT